MKNIAVGVVVLIVVICAGVFAQKYFTAQRALALAGDRIEQLEEQLQAAMKEVESSALDSKARIQELELQVNDMQRLFAMRGDAPQTEGIVETRVEDASPETVEPPATAEPEGDPQPDAMERAQRAQVDVLLGMLYDDLIAQWALPEDAEARLRGYLADASLEAQRTMLRDMGEGKLTAKEAHARQEEIEGRLREQLAKELNRDALAQWDAYDETSDEAMYRIVLDGQLTMMAQGLVEENRWAVRDVFAEELATHLDTFNQSDAPYTRDNFNQAQLNALNAGLVRLSEQLEPDQYAQAERYVQQAANMFQQMAGQSSNQ
ncbi:MAG: hypothetical protein AMXMBFR84_27060 [Candidatus Hydrogenedentota bacterium]